MDECFIEHLTLVDIKPVEENSFLLERGSHDSFLYHQRSFQFNAC